MRPKVNSALIFAAGFGTRMGALTKDQPKPLIKVADRPLLDHALDVARGSGVGNIVVNVHYLHEQIADHLAGAPDVSLSVEQPRVLETGGGLRKARALLGTGPVYTLNSDAVWTGENPLTTLSRAWRPGMGALLLLVAPENAVGHRGQGDFIADSDERLTRGAGGIYTGAQIIDPEGIEQIEEEAFSLNILWDRFAAEGRLFGVSHAGGWCDVGHPEGIALAEDMLAEARNV